MSGIVLVDKPQGITSHDVVSRVRRAAGTRKVGHAGTLDPMATGLVLVGVDNATRLLHFLVGLDKEYFATIRLGWGTTTDDAEGDRIESNAPALAPSALTDDAIAAEIARLTGEIEQVPSTVSAIKVDGKRAYALARAGEEVELKARRVTVSAFELLGRRDGVDHLDLDVRVECSSGTYIRALARDLGWALGSAAHLTALRRTRIGRFHIADAAQLDTLADTIDQVRISPSDAARRTLPIAEVSAAEAVDLGHGKRIAVPTALAEASGPIAAIDGAERLVAICERRGIELKVITGFPQEAS
ncbi:MAG TPA: tRNA pseudouridine(55) synthase TruB [Candidatus Lumbricidophila sp.]|nr:tRNA pseudouridine(55) synthase TruB [Candidatus Lumbricidophila sp.]